jgi:DNA mismatch repair protein MutS
VSPREVVYLKESLDAITLKTWALESSQEAVKIIETVCIVASCYEKIKTTLNQDAPVAIAKGNAIAKGVNAELDELRASHFRKEFLEGIENESHN